MAGVVQVLGGLRDSIEDLSGLAEIALEEDDEQSLAEVFSEMLHLEEDLAKLEFQRMFNGEMDPNNAYLEIQSGSGGTEAQDWAEMILRMYLRWSEKHGFQAEVVDLSPGDVAGIKGATVLIKGEFSYGWMRTETGVHRLVRKSPFDSGNRRHTSFASVFVSPEIDEDIEIEINPSEVRVDTYRASGAGGQHVNRTDSAVRLTHIPTGVVVECQDDRSQHKNKAKAMALLVAKLKQNEIDEQQNTIASERKILVGTGDRSEKIRTYNFPQGRITDHRIKLTQHNLDQVMDGDMISICQALITENQLAQLSNLEETS